MHKAKKNTFQGTELVLLSILFVLLFVPSEYIVPLHSTIGKMFLLSFVVYTSYYYGMISSIISAFIVIIILHSNYEGHCSQNCKHDEESTTKLKKRDLESTNIDDVDDEDIEDEDIEDEDIEDEDIEDEESIQNVDVEDEK